MVHLTVPLDHEKVVCPQGHEYTYESVKSVLDHELGRIKAFIERLKPWMYAKELDGVPDEQADMHGPYWNNGYFSGDDARIAYAIVRMTTPGKIVEIGSGNSTKFFRKAISDAGSNTRLISIDPEPRSDIMAVADQIVRESVLSVNIDMFASLRSGDILFLDGSHLLFNGTDTARFFLEIFPAVNPGVLVHVHDIMLPFEYDEEFTRRGYNEQYALATVLLNSPMWKPLVPVYYLCRLGLLQAGGVSFWMTAE